jgi:hypothetical protein
MEARGSLIMVLSIIAIIATSCYPRVSLTKAEKQLIPLKGSCSEVRMESDAGVIYTQRFERWNRRYESHFDVFWAKHVVHRERGGFRGYYNVYSGSSRFSRKAYSFNDLSMMGSVYFTKQDDLESLNLSISGFTEEYVLNASTPDTLVFDDHERPPDRINGKGIDRVVWHSREGLLAIQMLDGTMWRRVP